ncbi:MAG: Sensor histidine kinase [Sphingomonas bacterium]|jgi:two-component system KDP operon response regulator KdpE|uniref:response regulator n=1 Tax=Sphingomonas bacterium TaxID=1895847 RepID=UPI00261784F1|nr:response regulator [Sphingomonas bacterium]MDB5712412.1 Sensor histidine kinase [Sphingomonas bacterium]
MSNAAGILIVEDDAHIRRLLRATVERAGYRAAEAATAREGLSLLDIDKPDLVLLDLGLPDRDGLELIQLIKAKGAAVIIASAREETAEKVAALDLGADDYLTKPFDTEELLARIRAALRHRLSGTTAETMVTIGDVSIDLENRRVTRAGDDVHLSPKEYGVLAQLASKPGRIFGHAQLLRDVWGPAHDNHVEYLRIVIRNLRQKLEADPARPALIRNEVGVGYRLIDG